MIHRQSQKSGLYTERSEPQHEYQSCQAKDPKSWKYNFESGVVYNDTLFLNQYYIRMDNHAGTKVELLEKVFVYSVSIEKW
jgi:hypothetical protein